MYCLLNTSMNLPEEVSPKTTFKGNNQLLQM
jgi:hypothetical protein